MVNDFRDFLWPFKICSINFVRKKCLIHAKSQFHVNAENILESAENNSLPNAIDQLHKSEYVGTSKLFRSAYFLAKKDRLLQLQDLNGADIPKGLRSRYSATAVITHAAREMTQKISQQIIKEDYLDW